MSKKSSDDGLIHYKCCWHCHSKCGKPDNHLAPCGICAPLKNLVTDD